jgi:hypothetical protein
MLHNYKPYQLYRMYNKYEKTFIFSKDEKIKWNCWKYRYKKNERLLWGEIKPEHNNKSYKVWLCFLKSRKKNELIINYNSEDKHIVRFD